jgi:hypothetical protein
MVSVSYNIYRGNKMSRSRREQEGDLSGRDIGLIGERQEKVTGYENATWSAVNKMVEGDYPTTNIATVACASHHGGGHSSGRKEGGSTPMKVKGSKPHHMREMEVSEPNKRDTGAAMKKGGHAHKKHMAAGGVGKVRKDQY